MNHVPARFFSLGFPLIAASLLCSTSAFADPCRVTATDAFLGVDASGTPGHLGVQARVKTFPNDGYLAAMGGKPVAGVRLQFQVIFPDESGLWALGEATTNRAGWAALDLTPLYGRDEQGFYLLAGEPGMQTKHRLRTSQYIQVLVWSVDEVDQCDDGEVLPDVYGSMYFRHPLDTSPILFSDFDDTLFNSSDLVDIFRTLARGHYLLIDNAVVDATRSFRNAGGVFIGVTAQFSSLRPFTRSELLQWEFDVAYDRQNYYYDDAGFDGSYLARTLTYLANNEYPGTRTGADYDSDHCAYKVEKFTQLVDGVFGGHWEQVVGMIGDSEHSDGCAARETGIHWYALMEGSDRVEDTSDPASYTEILGGWSEALPILCDDAGLACGW